MLSLVKVRRNVLVTPKQTRGIGTKDQDLKFVDEPLLDMRTVDRDALETAIGAPAEQLQRSVVIQKRCKSPTQSGRRFNNGWRIRFKTGTQWTNPLMGWTAGNDPMSGINLNFDSLEEAKTWAVSNGYNYEIDDQVSDLKRKEGGYQAKFTFRPPNKRIDYDAIE